jgi:hypothetical protein
MHKYAALTALVIALNITMLTSSFSTSSCVRGWGSTCIPNNDYGCSRRCGNWWIRPARHCKPGVFCDVNVIPPDLRACLATCMAEKKAARH